MSERGPLPKPVNPRDLNAVEAKLRSLVSDSSTVRSKGPSEPFTFRQIRACEALVIETIRATLGLEKAPSTYETRNRVLIATRAALEGFAEINEARAFGARLSESRSEAPQAPLSEQPSAPAGQSQ